MARLRKIKVYLPEIIETNEDLKSDFPEADFSNLEKKVGIKQRHKAHDYETAVDLGFMAATQLLANEKRDEIDFLLFCTQSPDYFLPTSACILQEKLGLKNDIGALDFNLGCSGYIYGLAMAKGFIKANIANKILLITSETYSKHIHHKDKANRSIFGDGAAATLIDNSSDGIFEFILGTDGKGAKDLIVPNGCFRKKYDPEIKGYEYGTGNITDDNHLYMNGPEIFNFTIDNIPRVVVEILEKNHLELNEIDFFVFHQANKFMLNHLRKKIGIPKEKFYINLENTGNTVSSTIPIGLKDAIDNGFITRGDKVMIVGFGVGLSLGGTVIKI